MLLYRSSRHLLRNELRNIVKETACYRAVLLWELSTPSIDKGLQESRLYMSK